MGVLNLPATTGSNIGVINQGGTSLISTYGSQNFFAGPGAGNFSLTGGNNVGVGYNALNALTGGGSNNIAIGNLGTANDSGVIRIGTQPAQNSTYIAGISSNTNLGTIVGPVYVDTNGQLGVGNSSVNSGIPPTTLFAGMVYGISANTTLDFFSPIGTQSWSSGLTGYGASYSYAFNRTLTLKNFNVYYTVGPGVNQSQQWILTTNGVAVGPLYNTLIYQNTSSTAAATLTDTTNTIVVPAGVRIGVKVGGYAGGNISWSFEAY